jgi:hypothetical protein
MFHVRFSQVPCVQLTREQLDESKFLTAMLVSSKDKDEETKGGNVTTADDGSVHITLTSLLTVSTQAKKMALLVMSNQNVGTVRLTDELQCKELTEIGSYLSHERLTHMFATENKDFAACDMGDCDGLVSLGPIDMKRETRLRILGPKTPVKATFPVVAEAKQTRLHHDNSQETRDLLEFLHEASTTGDQASSWNMVVAGGSVNAILGGEDTFRVGDVDLFIVEDLTKTPGRTAVDAVRQALECLEKSINWRYWASRTRHSVTISRPSGPCLQLILRVYPSVEAVIQSFDIDCCCVVLDPRTGEISASARGLHAFVHKVNVVRTDYFSPTCENRLVKYQRRGFAIMDPGFMPGRVLHKKIKLTDAFGLKRLLMLLEKDSHQSDNSVLTDVYGPMFEAVFKRLRRHRNIQVPGGGRIIEKAQHKRLTFLIRNGEVCSLLDVQPEERDHVHPGLANLSDLDTVERGTFVHLKGPWYAQAYGVGWKNDDVKASLEERYKKFAWNKAKRLPFITAGNVKLVLRTVTAPGRERCVWNLDTNQIFDDDDSPKVADIARLMTMVKSGPDMLDKLEAFLSSGTGNTIVSDTISADTTKDEDDELVIVTKTDDKDNDLDTLGVVISVPVDGVVVPIKIAFPDEDIIISDKDIAHVRDCGCESYRLTINNRWRKAIERGYINCCDCKKKITVTIDHRQWCCDECTATFRTLNM